MQYQEQIERYFDEKQEEILNSICRLVRINSEKMTAKEGMPYGEGPYLALKEALLMAEELGFVTKNYDNYVGTADFNDLEKGLDILAHLDVVPGGDGWNITTPFEPVIEDGKLYGRGTADDKGPAVAALYAMKAVKDLGIPLKKNVRLIMGTDEECGSSDIPHYYAVEEEAPATFSPDGDFPLINIEKGSLRASFAAAFSEDKKLPRILSVEGGIKINVVPGVAKGRLEGISLEAVQEKIAAAEQETGAAYQIALEEEELIVTAVGANAHASTPYEGNNALTALLHLFAKLPIAPSVGYDKLMALLALFPHGDCSGKAAGVAMSDQESGELTLNFGILDYTVTGLTGGFDCRAPICATNENVRDIIRDRMAAAGIELEQKDLFPPHYVPADTPFIKSLLNCYEAYTGLKGECLAIGGGTYVHELERGVAFGCCMPGTDNHMHGADEFVVIADIITSGKIFAQAIVELCG